MQTNIQFIFLPYKRKPIFSLSSYPINANQYSVYLLTFKVQTNIQFIILPYKMQINIQFIFLPYKCKPIFSLSSYPINANQ